MVDNGDRLIKTIDNIRQVLFGSLCSSLRVKQNDTLACTVQGLIVGSSLKAGRQRIRLQGQGEGLPGGGLEGEEGRGAVKDVRPVPGNRTAG